MSTTNVRSYTDKQILDKVRTCPSFKSFPQNYWLIGVRSNEDSFNRFDDKFYLFRGEKFIKTWVCTTNAGTDMLNPSNARGEAVLKSGDIYYDSHERRSHRGRVMAYGQRRALPIHRDNDEDRKTEESGTARNEIVGINIHPASYVYGNKIEREFIMGWSQGCQVFQARDDFDEFMEFTKGQQILTYCLLLEWDPKTVVPPAPKPVPQAASVLGLSSAPETEAAATAAEAEDAGEIQEERTVAQAEEAAATGEAPPFTGPRDPALDRDNVVIEKQERVKLWDYIKLKIAGLTGGTFTYATAINNLQQVQELGLGPTWAMYLVIGGVVVAFIILIIWVISWWSDENQKEKRTQDMIRENSTPDNRLHFASKDELELWKKWGAAVVRR